MNDLVTSKGTPTHRLTVKLEDGTFRTFYLLEQEAEWIATAVNGVDPFIVLPKTIDPAAPSFYPKRGAWLERMKPEEVEARQRRYAPPAPAEVAAETAAARAAAKEWIAKHSADFDRLQVIAHGTLEKSGGGFFRMASKGVRASLAKFEAQRRVYETFLNAPDPYASLEELLGGSAPVA